MIADMVAGAFLVTMLTILVRPGSKGSAFVVALTTATVAVVSQVTDIANGTDTTNDSSGQQTYDDFNQQYNN